MLQISICDLIYGCRPSCVHFHGQTVSKCPVQMNAYAHTKYLLWFNFYCQQMQIALDLIKISVIEWVCRIVIWHDKLMLSSFASVWQCACVCAFVRAASMKIVIVANQNRVWKWDFQRFGQAWNMHHTFTIRCGSSSNGGGGGSNYDENIIYHLCALRCTWFNRQLVTGNRQPATRLKWITTYRVLCTQCDR